VTINPLRGSGEPCVYYDQPGHTPDQRPDPAAYLGLDPDEWPLCPHCMPSREQLTGEPPRACGKCGQQFDPTDMRFDGRAEERSAPGYCRGCVDNCHESGITHACVICARKA
jgi:hypothetical protein